MSRKRAKHERGKASPRARRRRGPALVLAATFLLGALWEREGPPELGRVRWGRDLEGALVRAASEGRPLFVLFQEVPGCSTCVSFGELVLSHPLLVEAIETEFLPVFVYNNRPGRDAETLERFGEPAWNNPVVRFLDAAGRDLLPRRAGIWTPHGIGTRMILALERAGRAVPSYLRDAVDETRPRDEERASFGMYCYWSGEGCLGGIPGVLASRTGFLESSEVVEVRFDREAISYGELLRAVEQRGCAERVFAHGDAQETVARQVFGDATAVTRARLREARDRDQKYYLRRSPLGRLELTARQAVRVNAALAEGLDPITHLSPRQRSRVGGKQRP